MKEKKSSVSELEIRNEFSRSAVGDSRLQSRLESIVGKIAEKPTASFPQIFPEEADCEGFYRFVRNENVSWGKIIEGHYRQLSERSSDFEEVIAIHDSSALKSGITDPDTDLGKILSKGNYKSAGFMCHFSFVVGGINNPKPLGVSNVYPLRRFGESTKTKGAKESSKWIEGVKATRSRLRVQKIIHVMDAEADAFSLFESLLKTSEGFVVRVAQEKRKVYQDNRQKQLNQALKGLPILCEREIRLTKKSAGVGSKARRKYPARDARTARLKVTANAIELKVPAKIRDSELPKTIKVNVVHVFESNPEPGEKPVDWKLYTTQPIDTQEQILKIVDIYRVRWFVEEFFKALKSGCSYEARQFRSFKTAMNVVALLLPIAWQIVSLRYFSRTRNEDCKNVFSPLQIKILISLYPTKLNLQSTGFDLFNALARLGGHLKNNGTPGYLVLYRGMRELYSLERGTKLQIGAMQ